MISYVSLVLKLNIRACLKRQRNWQRVGLKNDVQIKQMEELTLSFFHREYKQFHVISLKTHLIDIRWHKYQKWRLLLWTVTSPSALWREPAPATMGQLSHVHLLKQLLSWFHAASDHSKMDPWPSKKWCFWLSKSWELKDWTWGLIKT